MGQYRICGGLLLGSLGVSVLIIDSSKKKIGQMTQIDKSIATVSTLRDLSIGSVVSGGGTKPFEGADSADWADFVDGLQKAAIESRLGIPIFYGIDVVHGNSFVEGATIFPHNVGLGATRKKIRRRKSNGLKPCLYKRFWLRKMGRLYASNEILTLQSYKQFTRITQTLAKSDSFVITWINVQHQNIITTFKMKNNIHQKTTVAFEEHGV